MTNIDSLSGPLLSSDRLHWNPADHQLEIANPCAPERITGWDQGFRHLVYRDDQWRRARHSPRLYLQLPSDPTRDPGDPRSRLAATVPAHLLALTAGFSHQFEMLTLLREGGERALRLARDHIVTLWLVAAEAERRDLDPGSVAHVLLNRPVPALLGWALGNARATTQRFVDCLVPDPRDDAALATLRHLLRDADFVANFGSDRPLPLHVAVRGYGHARLLAELLLEEVGDVPAEQRQALTAQFERELAETRRLLAPLLREDEVDRLLGLDNVHRLRDAALADLARNLPDHPLAPRTLARSSFEGTDTLRPILAARDLLDDPNTVDLLGAAHRGECFLFRVLEPESATLVMMPAGPNAWRVQDLRVDGGESSRPSTHPELWNHLLTTLRAAPLQLLPGIESSCLFLPEPY